MAAAAGAIPAAAPVGGVTADMIALLIREGIERGFAERDARTAGNARAERDAREANNNYVYSGRSLYYSDSESDIEPITAAELRIESKSRGYVSHQDNNVHFCAGVARHDRNSKPRHRTIEGNKYYAKCTDSGRDAPGPIAKALAEAESGVYDLFNLRDIMFNLLGMLHWAGDQDSEFYNSFAQCCNSIDELYRLRNLERSLLVAWADAVGPSASPFKKELARYLVSATEADANAPDNVEANIQALTDRFVSVVVKAERNVFAKKAAYSDNGGGGSGAGGYGAARQDKAKHEPKHKDKQRGTRGGSDKHNGDGDRRGSPRGGRHVPNQREPHGRSTCGNGSYKREDSHSHGRSGHEQQHEPRDARGKTARGDRNGGGGRGGGGGGRGGGRPDYDRRKHGEASRQGQHEDRRGERSDASDSN